MSPRTGRVLPLAACRLSGNLTPTAGHAMAPGQVIYASLWSPRGVLRTVFTRTFAIESESCRHLRNYFHLFYQYAQATVRNLSQVLQETSCLSYSCDDHGTPIRSTCMRHLRATPGQHGTPAMPYFSETSSRHCNCSFCSSCKVQDLFVHILFSGSSPAASAHALQGLKPQLGSEAVSTLLC